MEKSVVWNTEGADRDWSETTAGLWQDVLYSICEERSFAKTPTCRSFYVFKGNVRNVEFPDVHKPLFKNAMQKASELFPELSSSFTGIVELHSTNELLDLKQIKFIPEEKGN